MPLLSKWCIVHLLKLIVVLLLSTSLVKQTGSMIGRITSKVRRTLNDMVFNTAIGSTRVHDTHRNIILMYHGIDVTGQNLFNGRHTPVSFFEKQIQFLKANYTILPLSEFFAAPAGPQRLCAITFDDGYINNLTNALPVLEKYNAPATFFITGMNEIGCDILWADFVNIANKICHKDISIDNEMFVKKGEGYVAKDRGVSLMDVVKNEKPEYIFKEKIYQAFNPHLNFRKEEAYKVYWQLMNDEQIKKLSKSKVVSIGSHGYFHNNMGNIAHEAAYEEIRKSKAYLENIVQKPVTELGYPDGSYNDAVSSYAAKAGMIYQTCTELFRNDKDRNNPHLKNRAGVYNFDSAANQLLSALNYPL